MAHACWDTPKWYVTRLSRYGDPKMVCDSLRGSMYSKSDVDLIPKVDVSNYASRLPSENHGVYCFVVEITLSAIMFSDLGLFVTRFSNSSTQE
ncbi:hypothetical protein AAHA92_05951 [Salvia divinorum]|uniref:Uncharacterized protein n=1 Tax=Salvia divinorum TaxID=28513 RepID=A0ABD1I6C3_SALDI